MNRTRKPNLARRIANAQVAVLKEVNQMIQRALNAPWVDHVSSCARIAPRGTHRPITFAAMAVAANTPKKNRLHEAWRAQQAAEAAAGRKLLGIG